MVAYTRTTSGLHNTIIQQTIMSNVFWLKVFNKTGCALRNRPLWLESQTLWVLGSNTEVSLTLKRQANPRP